MVSAPLPAGQPPNAASVFAASIASRRAQPEPPPFSSENVFGVIVAAVADELAVKPIVVRRTPSETNLRNPKRIPHSLSRSPDPASRVHATLTPSAGHHQVRLDDRRGLAAPRWDRGDRGPSRSAGRPGRAA